LGTANKTFCSNYGLVAYGRIIFSPGRILLANLALETLIVSHKILNIFLSMERIAFES